MPAAIRIVLCASALVISTFNSFSVLATQASRVTIDLTDRAGLPVANPYIGLVAVDSPWREPVVEEIGQSSVVWSVPQGTYRVVAGAPGYRNVHSGVLAIGSEPRRVAFAIEPLARIGGTVTDRSGEPVQGARVGLLGEFLDHDLLLSPRAQAHLRANTLVETDVEGRFVLPVPAEGRVFLVIEATGFAPTVRRNVSVASTPELPPIVLERGATLKVSWSQARPSLSADRIQLLPVNVVLPADLPSDRAVAVWTRTIRGSEATWGSLIPGEYDVLLRLGDERPVQLSRVRLAPGDTKRLDVELPGSAQAEKPIPGEQPLRLFIPTTAPDAWRGAKVTQWIDGSPSALPVRRRAVAGGVRLEVTGRCVPDSRIVASSESIVAVTTLGTGRCDTQFELAEHTTARVTATLAPPVGSKLPSSAIARYPGCRDRIELPVLIRKQELAFDVVADCGEALVSVGAFASFTIGPARITAGESTNLGVIHLTHSGSLLLRVLDLNGQPAAGARVFAYRRRELEEFRGELSLESLRPLVRTSTDGSGWLRLSSLPAEDIVLGLIGAGDRLPFFTGPIAVVPRQEHVLGDVHLPGSADVEVAITLASELAGIASAKSVLLRRLDPHWPERAFLTASTDKEIARLNALPAGDWVITPVLTLSDGSGLVGQPTNISVMAGVPNRVTADSGLRAFRGRVTRGGDPVSGRLVFRPVPGTAGRTVNAVGGADGVFIVPLAGPGAYKVVIRDQSGRTFQPADTVRFSDPDRRVEVQLGTGRITGTVMSPDGRPVRGAEVIAEQVRQTPEAGAEAHALTGDDGSFEIDGIEEGLWSVVASGGSRRSSRRAVTVGQQPVAVVLELRDQSDLSVTVTDAVGQPVAKATVVVSAVGLPAGVRAKSQIAVTDERGIVTFNDTDRSSARMLNVAARTQNGAVTTTLVPPAADIVVTFPPTFGALVLRRAEGQWTSGAYRRLIAEDGSWFGPGLVAVQTGADTLVLSQVPPGLWRFAEAATAAEAYGLEAGDLTAVRILGSAVVSPGSTTELVVKVPGPARPGSAASATHAD